MEATSDTPEHGHGKKIQAKFLWNCAGRGVQIYCHACSEYVQANRVCMRLGHIDMTQEELTELLGNGDVEITLE